MTTRLVVAVAVGALLGAGAWALRGPAGDAPKTAPERAGFRVVYRVEDTAGSEPVVLTEVLEVRRPYESRLSQRPGPPPGGRVQSATVTNRTHYWSLGAGGEYLYAFRRPPEGPEREASIDALREGARAGLAAKAGDATVARVACERFIFREPYPKPLQPATDVQRVEVCIGDGIVLRESWTISGKQARLWEAVEADAEWTPPFGRFLTGRRPKETRASRLIASQQRVREGNVSLENALRPQAPEGFARDRRASVSEPGAQARLTYVETYVRGPELVVLEQGTSPTGPPWGPEEGAEVYLGRAGTGRLVHYPDHVEVRITGQRSFVRVRAPGEALALHFARTLA